MALADDFHSKKQVILMSRIPMVLSAAATWTGAPTQQVWEQCLGGRIRRDA
jgi:hypothetical protein